MKYICTFACQFRGVLVRPDTIVEISDEEARTNPMVKNDFAPYDAEAKAAAVDEDERDQFGMSKQDYRNRLSGLGAVFSPTDSLDQLRKTLERVTSDAPRKRRKPE